MAKVQMVPCVDACGMPPEVLDWCMDNDISTHYASELHQVEADSPLIDWMKSLGHEFDPDEKDYWVGVWGS